MKNYRTGTLPPDLKTFPNVKRHEVIKDALLTIASLLLFVALLFLFMIAAATPEPETNPPGWEEVRV